MEKSIQQLLLTLLSKSEEFEEIAKQKSLLHKLTTRQLQCIDLSLNLFTKSVHFMLTGYSYTVLDAKVNYTFRKWTFGLTVENLMNTEWNEAQFAGDYKANETAEPEYGLTFTPGTPLFLEAGICFQF